MTFDVMPVLSTHVAYWLSTKNITIRLLLGLPNGLGMPGFWLLTSALMLQLPAAKCAFYSVDTALLVAYVHSASCCGAVVDLHGHWWQMCSASGCSRMLTAGLHANTTT